MDRKLFRASGHGSENTGMAPPGGDVEEILPASADMYEKWW